MQLLKSGWKNRYCNQIKFTKTFSSGSFVINCYIEYLFRVVNATRQRLLGTSSFCNIGQNLHQQSYVWEGDLSQKLSNQTCDYHLITQNQKTLCIETNMFQQQEITNYCAGNYKTAGITQQHSSQCNVDYNQSCD